jgi:hypothetical protein
MAKAMMKLGAQGSRDPVQRRQRGMCFAAARNVLRLDAISTSPLAITSVRS